MAGASSMQVTGPQVQKTSWKFNVSYRERGEEEARSWMLRKAALRSLLTADHRAPARDTEPHEEATRSVLGLTTS